MPPGYPECLQYFLSSRFEPVTATLAALTTITLSPQSTCGAQIGLCLPRSNVDTSVARRPSTTSDASTTSHARSMSLALGWKVGTAIDPRLR